MLRRYIGDREFYKKVFAVAIPIILQNSITHFVSLLDNIMVGQLGDPQMSGVSIANQIMMICNLCIFGASSGAGIFTAQFRGSGNHQGIRHTFRFKVLCLTLISLISIAVLIPAGKPLIGLFLTGDGNIADAAATLEFGLDYMAIMLVGFVPFALTNAYASTLRECGQTKVPMYAGISAVLVNLVGNYIFIFGHFGAPSMGVQGAALATVISRFVELAVVSIWTHRNSAKNPFIRGAYRSLSIPAPLLRRIILKGMPLLINEAMWSFGVAALNQSYSTCGLEVVNAVNIASTINNLASVVTMALGNTIGIIMGQLLGSGLSKEAISDNNRKLLTLCVAAGVVFAGLLASISGLFPLLYNTTDSVRATATGLILIIAAMKPFHAYMYSAYFSLRAGGKTWVTFVYDGGFMCFVSVPLAFLLTRFTNLPILPVYAICQSADVMKCVLGFILLRKGDWMNNLT